MSTDRHDLSVNNATSYRMSRTRGRDTAPEIAVRKLIHAMGLRYRVNTAPIPGFRRSADIVFCKERVAVMIDGCFWHGCPLHYRPATIRSDFWSKKCEDNQRRDRETNARLRAAGWLVLRYWEHEIPSAVADSIKSAILQRREDLRHGPIAKRP